MAGPVGNPSTIWTTLTIPNPPQGAIPFIWTDNASPTVDVLNLWWNQAAQQLSLHCGGDQTGSDSLNAYLQCDSYWPYSLAGLNAGSALGATATAGFTVSSSRGTGPTPQYSLNGDFIGQFSAWNWNGAAPVWSELGCINFYCSGSIAANNLGGEMRLGTKIDNGLLTEFVKLTNAGAFTPMAASGAQLGAANLGWKQLNLDYTISGSAGAQTINKPAGSFKIAAAASSVVITNSLVTANSIVIAVLQSNDATALYVKSCIPGAGSFTVTMNATATGQITVGFIVINTDS